MAQPPLGPPRFPHSTGTLEGLFWGEVIFRSMGPLLLNKSYFTSPLLPVLFGRTHYVQSFPSPHPRLHSHFHRKVVKLHEYRPAVGDVIFFEDQYGIERGTVTCVHDLRFCIKGIERRAQSLYKESDLWARQDVRSSSMLRRPHGYRSYGDGEIEMCYCMNVTVIPHATKSKNPPGT